MQYPMPAYPAGPYAGGAEPLEKMHGLHYRAFTAYFAEFLGTYVLAFSVGCCVLFGNSMLGPVAVGGTLAVLMYVTGPISGGHLNPAVTMSACVAKRISTHEAAVYILSQFMGGFLGAVSYCLLFWENFTIGPMRGFDWWQMAAAEVAYTFMLCFVVLNCQRNAAEKSTIIGSPAEVNAHSVTWMGAGLVVVAGGYGAAAISGGCFNPAIAFGIDLTSVNLGFGWCWAYVGCQLVGAAMAAAAFRLVRPEEYAARSSTVTYTDSSDLHASLPIMATEFIGTFMLCLTVGLCLLAASPATAVSAGAAIAAMILSVGDVSGDFNPAVTVAMWAIAQPQGPGGVRTGACISVQFIAGVLATLAYSALYRFSYIPDKHQRPDSWWLSSGIVECLFTGQFVLVCLVKEFWAPRPWRGFASREAERAPSQQHGALAVGLAGTACSFVSYTIVGGTVNPALTAGLMILRFSGTNAWQLLTLFAAEICGAFITAGLFANMYMPHYGDRSK